MIYEIRNYHFRPDLLDRYRTWARSRAVPHLSGQMDVLGFWVSTSDAAEVNGEPHDRLGVANVTWIIGWRDLAHRNTVLPQVLSSPAWTEIFADVPGGRESYLRVEAKFADSLM